MEPKDIYFRFLCDKEEERHRRLMNFTESVIEEAKLIDDYDTLYCMYKYQEEIRDKLPELEYIKSL